MVKQMHAACEYPQAKPGGRWNMKRGLEEAECERKCILSSHSASSRLQFVKDDFPQASPVIQITPLRG